MTICPCAFCKHLRIIRFWRAEGNELKVKNTSRFHGISRHGIPSWLSPFRVIHNNDMACALRRLISQSTWLFFTRGQFWPSSVVAVCMCLSVCCVSVCPCVYLELVRTITCDPFKPGSPNLEHGCKNTLVKIPIVWWGLGWRLNFDHES